MAKSQGITLGGPQRWNGKPPRRPLGMAILVKSYQSSIAGPMIIAFRGHRKTLSRRMIPAQGCIQWHCHDIGSAVSFNNRGDIRVVVVTSKTDVKAVA